MSRLLRKKQDKKLTQHTFLYKKNIRAHQCLSVGVNNSCRLVPFRGQKRYAPIRGQDNPCPSVPIRGRKKLRAD